MYCTNCGKPLTPSAKFCAECGFKVGGVPTATTPVPATSYGSANVYLLDAGPKKIDVIKVIRQLTNLGLVEAKTLSETPNAVVLANVPRDVADDAVNKLRYAGAQARAG